MKKGRLQATFMSLVLSAGVLAACSGGAEQTSTTEKKSDGGYTIKIGANLELSGNVASYGTGILNGLELAIEEINKEGIDGKKIELIKHDNKSEAAEATSGALKLINQDGVSAIVGAATTTNTLAQVQLAQDNKVPVITPSGTNPDITFKDGKLNDFLFRTCFIDPFQGEIAANFAADNLGVKSAAILIDNNSDYAKGLAAAFKKAFEAKGGKVIVQEAYAAKDTEFRTQLTSIKGKSPEFVYIPGYYEEAGLIIKQAKELGLDVPFMGGDGWDSPTLVDIAGADALNNAYITNHYSSGDTDEKIQSFVNAFEAKHGKKPDAFNALGYDTGYLLADAIKRAGSGDSEAIQKALAETTDLSLVTGNFTYDEKHNPVKTATILTYENGEQVFETKVNP
ncbi:ABC transporter substrate-binding protein [Niallia sp. XMNu-256]|uniref:ABC transporter substrate-binding protein n=1 Tax=Niallia sp. XMNu-256 TaxID=3082444 RepID=UPI0030D20BD0